MELFLVRIFRYSRNSSRVIPEIIRIWTLFTLCQLMSFYTRCFQGMWSETSGRNWQKQPPKVFYKHCNFIKNGTLVQVLSCEFCEIVKNTFFTEHIQTAATEIDYNFVIQHLYFLKNKLKCNLTHVEHRSDLSICTLFKFEHFGPLTRIRFVCNRKCMWLKVHGLLRLICTENVFYKRRL